MNGENGMRFTTSWPSSDLEMMEQSVDDYINNPRFHAYYMTFSGHGPYSAENGIAKRNFDTVKELLGDRELKEQAVYYLAANYELEKAMAYLVKTLEEKGIADDTVICISTDHFPYGLDSEGSLGNMPYLSELYGYQVNDLFQRDHSRLILWSGCIEKMEPIVVSTPTSSLDIIPTLSNLFGTEYDSRLFVGRDVFSDQQALVFNSNYEWKTAYGIYKGGKFTQTDMNVTLPDNYVDQMKTVVRNKMRYCQWVLENDYFRYLFG
jgi:lipoteichoic acid synthase